MQDVKAEVDELRRTLESQRRRIRLQMLLMAGVLSILVFAQGGADVVATALVETDAWTIRTKNSAGTLTPRLVATTDVDHATVRITGADLVLDSTAGSQANLKLAEQTAAPAGAPGKLWYDSTQPASGMLKVYNGTSWAQVGGGGGLLRAPQVLTSGTSYSPPAGTNSIIVVLVGAGGGGGSGTTSGTFGANKTPGGGGGSGSFVQRYISSPGTCTYSIGSGGAGGSSFTVGGSGGATTFTFGTTTLTAPGGGGGDNGSSTVTALGGAGGAQGTNGDINGAGSPGISMAGGSSIFGGGGAGHSAGGPGNPGLAFGSGGGGAMGNSAGGTGAQGVIIVYEYR